MSEIKLQSKIGVRSSYQVLDLEERHIERRLFQFVEELQEQKDKTKGMEEDICPIFERQPKPAFRSGHKEVKRLLVRRKKETNCALFSFYGSY